MLYDEINNAFLIKVYIKSYLIHKYNEEIKNI